MWMSEDSLPMGSKDKTWVTAYWQAALPIELSTGFFAYSHVFVFSACLSSSDFKVSGPKLRSLTNFSIVFFFFFFFFCQSGGEGSSFSLDMQLSNFPAPSVKETCLSPKVCHWRLPGGYAMWLYRWVHASPVTQQIVFNLGFVAG
jgi:hypothetical protein